MMITRVNLIALRLICSISVELKHPYNNSVIINCLLNWEHILITILLGSNLCRSHAGHGYLNAFAWPVYLPNIPHTANNFIYKKFVFLDTFIMFLCYVIVFSGIVLKTYVYCTSGGSFMSKAELCLMSFFVHP